MSIGQENLLRPHWNAPSNVIAVVTTRRGGSSQGNFASLNLGAHVGDDPAHVSANRSSLMQWLDPGVKIQWLNQVHGNRVVAAQGSGELQTADAAVCRQAGIACCITTADCLPVFIAALDGKEVALAHAGWRGLAGGILENCVNAMATPAAGCVAWLGPAIGPCHFEVGSEVRNEFLVRAGSFQQAATSKCFVPVGASGKFMADLYALARIRLSALGIAEVSGGDACTYCDEEKFYSFRRQSVTGRMVSLIYLKPC